MNSSNRLYLAVLAAGGLSVVFGLSTSVGRSSRPYEVEAQVYTTPEYRTDATRAIDAYERVMQRYMDVTERNFADVLSYTGAIAARLDAIDVKLAGLDQRVERIERHLGILPPAPVLDPNAPRPVIPALPPVPPGR